MRESIRVAKSNELLRGRIGFLNGGGWKSLKESRFAGSDVQHCLPSCRVASGEREESTRGIRRRIRKFLQ